MFRLRRLLVELLLVTALEPRTHHHHHHHQQQCVDTKSQIEEHSRDKHLFRGDKNGRLIGIVKIIPSSPKENDNKTVTFPSNSPPSGKGKTKIDPSRRAALAQKWLSIEWTQPRVEWRGEDNHLCWERRRRRKTEIKFATMKVVNSIGGRMRRGKAGNWWNRNWFGDFVTDHRLLKFPTRKLVCKN